MYDIMIVDDTMANLKVLANMLMKQGYKVRTLTSGKQAIKSAQLKAPDLILLDINMPEMNGYDVCKSLKEMNITKDVPVIFISALTESRNIVYAFQNGGVDYITKPFQIDEVLARVKTQLKIVQGKKDITTLLSRTFTGSIGVMVEILSTTKPLAFDQAIQIRKLVRGVVEAIDLKDQWVYEIAAMLSRIGYVTLPDDKLLAYSKGTKSAITQDEHMQSIDYALNLVNKIPRLEPVEAILNLWYQSFVVQKFKEPLSKWEPAEIGVNMLKLIIEYIELSNQNHTQKYIYDELKSYRDMYHYELVDALMELESYKLANDELEILLTELSPHMVLSRDVLTIENVKLISRETEVTTSLLKLLDGYQKHMVIKEPIYVWNQQE